ncbi:hypothetical protein LCGC14_0470450 [marine sediment metagenome]|uniref:Uncharacterized protein n=1 Tax=marine sediment metagenome TaxID=412755 RepID=A0A0F9UZ53_9ZZZZ
MYKYELFESNGRSIGYLLLPHYIYPETVITDEGISVRFVGFTEDETQRVIEIACDNIECNQMEEAYLRLLADRFTEEVKL